MSSIEEKIFWLRGWLREYGGYLKTVDKQRFHEVFCLVYFFCHNIAVRVKSEDEKRLDEAILWCKQLGDWSDGD